MSRWFGKRQILIILLFYFHFGMRLSRVSPAVHIYGIFPLYLTALALAQDYRLVFAPPHSHVHDVYNSSRPIVTTCLC